MVETFETINLGFDQNNINFTLQPKEIAILFAPTGQQLGKWGPKDEKQHIQYAGPNMLPGPYRLKRLA